jgi:hypothetical protein
MAGTWPKGKLCHPTHESLTLADLLQALLPDIKPCSEFIFKSGDSFNAMCQLIFQLRLLSHRINAFLKFADPDHHAELLKVVEKINALIPSYKSLCAIDPLLYEGREILFNRLSGLHTDSQDPPLGYAILAAFGDFKGGYVYLPNLGLRIRLHPGDVILLRGRVVPHVIEEWDEGQRICIPHFTHSSTWRAAGNNTVFI